MDHSLKKQTCKTPEGEPVKTDKNIYDIVKETLGR